MSEFPRRIIVTVAGDTYHAEVTPGREGDGTVGVLILIPFTTETPDEAVVVFANRIANQGATVTPAQELLH